MTSETIQYPRTPADIYHSIADLLIEVEDVRVQYAVTRKYLGGRTSLFAPGFNEQMFQTVMQATQNTVNEYLQYAGGFPYEANQNGRRVDQLLEKWDGPTAQPGYHTWRIKGSREPVDINSISLLDQLRAGSTS